MAKRLLRPVPLLGGDVPKDLSDLERFVDLEAWLASEALRSGLTALRRYSFDDKGAFFSAMFMLSIGLERTLKMAIVFDHADQHGTPPSDKELRAIGHDLVSLLTVVRSVKQRRCLQVDESALDDELVRNATVLLSEFAKASRYYNLNALTNSSAQPTSEPLERWDREIAMPLVRRHFRPSRRARKNVAMAAQISERPGVVVAHTRDDGTRVANFLDLVLEGELLETKQKWSVWCAYQVVSFAVSVLCELGASYYLCEYFVLLRERDASEVTRRKRWGRP